MYLGRTRRFILWALLCVVSVYLLLGYVQVLITIPARSQPIVGPPRLEAGNLIKLGARVMPAEDQLDITSIPEHDSHMLVKDSIKSIRLLHDDRGPAPKASHERLSSDSITVLFGDRDENNNALMGEGGSEMHKTDDEAVSLTLADQPEEGYQFLADIDMPDVSVILSRPVDKSRWPSSLPSIEERTLNASTIQLFEKRPDYLPEYRSPCWVVADGTVSCLPTLFLAGFPKCATSDLHMHLTLHPQILTPIMKEPHYWTRTMTGRLSESFADYVAKYRFASRRIQGSCVQKNGWTCYHDRVTVDSSPSYIFDGTRWPFYAENQGLDEPRLLPIDLILYMIPQPRFALLLRDPTERMYSSYLYFLKGAPGTVEEFHESVVNGILLFDSCIKNMSLRACVYSYERETRYLVIGLYHIYIEDWLERIPRRYIYITRTEDYGPNQHDELQRVYTTFELEPFEESGDYAHKNEREDGAKHLGDMHPKTRQLLRTFYAPHNRRLAEMLEDTTYTWGYS